MALDMGMSIGIGMGMEGREGGGGSEEGVSGRGEEVVAEEA